jgi:hypothetical protein
MSDNQVDIQVVLAYLREAIAIQAQEIAILKATIQSLEGQQKTAATENSLEK